MDHVEYIIRFLLGEGNDVFLPMVSYGPQENAKVIIEPSSFFEDSVYMTEKSLPKIPLQKLEGAEILYGEPRIIKSDGQVRICADLVASAFFLLTRYEECVRRDIRDEHGRFPGKESLPYRAGFLHRPIVDEYGVLLRRYLRQCGVEIPEPAPGYRHIWLTHDVDTIWNWSNYYRALREVARRVLFNLPDKTLPLKAVRNYKRFDPSYTFPWLTEKDAQVRQVYGAERCTPLYFFMGCTKESDHDDGYMRKTKRTKELLCYLRGNDCAVGYHVSYQASIKRTETPCEIDRIEALWGKKITHNRNHFLASREPEDFRVLLNIGITDDFTMGYADVAGFRLGTSRPVNWIDPANRNVTNLRLHPMTVMECTLDRSIYMGIQKEDDAYHFVCELLSRIYEHGGEIVFLWHNPSVSEKDPGYHRSLYQRLLRHLIECHDRCPIDETN